VYGASCFTSAAAWSAPTRPAPWKINSSPSELTASTNLAFRQDFRRRRPSLQIVARTRTDHDDMKMQITDYQPGTGERLRAANPVSHDN
jgi:hypothetical protein